VSDSEDELGLACPLPFADQELIFARTLREMNWGCSNVQNGCETAASFFSPSLDSNFFLILYCYFGHKQLRV